MDIFAQQFLASAGKTIESIKPKMTWDKTDIESVIIKFTDGTDVTLTSMTYKGCEQCDYDGSVNNYLMFS